MDLALNNLQRLICHKTQTNKPKIGIKYQYLKTFNSMQINELWLVNKYYLKSIRFHMIYLIYTYKQNLALSNLQGLMCRKTQPIH